MSGLWGSQAGGSGGGGGDVTVVNSLASTSTVNALSAAQGKVLKDTADALATTVGGKAATSHTHTASQVSDFTEASQDVVGAMIVAAGGTYDDTANSITLPAGGGGLDAAGVRAVTLTGMASSGTALPTATDTVLSSWSKLLGWAGNLAANVRAAVLTGLSTSTSTAVAAGDTILVAIGKLQAQATLKANAADPSFTGTETHGGTDIFTAAAMGANSVDVTKARNTKTLTAAATLTFSATPGEGQEFGLELTGHSAAVTVTIPSSRNVVTNEDITTFVMPANGYAVLTWRRKGSVNLLAGVPGMKVMVPFAIQTPADGDYTIVLKSIWAGAITNLTTKSASGTCTLTGKINTTALGGTANSVTSTEQSQAHTSANVVAVGDDIVVTVSSNSTCSKLAGNIEMTVF